MKHLINKKTGVVFTWTEALAEHKDMVLYDFKKKKPVSQVPVREVEQAAETNSVEIEDEKERAAGLVKEWFDKDVSKVTKEDLAQYAMDKFGVEIEAGTKLSMVLGIEKQAIEEGI
jgi:hypothetical protein